MSKLTPINVDITAITFCELVWIVEVLDPMVLSSCVREVRECGCKEQATAHIPGEICKAFDEQLVLSGENRRLYVTLGQFSIIRLERDAQVVVPVLEYSIPKKECCDNPACAEDPCEMFSRIPFPANRFVSSGCDKRNEADNGCCYTTTGNT